MFLHIHITYYISYTMICVYARNLLTSIEHHIQYIHSPCAVNEKARGLVLAMCVYPFLARNTKSQKCHVLPRLYKKKNTRDALRGATTAPLGIRGAFTTDVQNTTRHEMTRSGIHLGISWQSECVQLIQPERIGKHSKEPDFLCRDFKKYTGCHYGLCPIAGCRPLAMAPVGSCWYILHTHTNVLMMIMTYHDCDDDDVGNHDNNTGYIEHNNLYIYNLFMSVPTFSLVLYLIAMVSLNYMKYCIPSKPSKTSIVETKVQRPQERDHLPMFSRANLPKGKCV